VAIYQRPNTSKPAAVYPYLELDPENETVG
jgi:hypothetical protein